MFWVCERSKAESISSRIYIGAGLKRRRERTRDKDTRERWPPLSSDKLSFQISPKATFTHKPSRKDLPAGTNFALAPGNKVENIDPKSLSTLKSYNISD